MCLEILFYFFIIIINYKAPMCLIFLIKSKKLNMVEFFWT